ncbi:MAG: methyltransferase domain-containing protein [Gammaproteobacteria bacterium]|nr:methyltransferase domain-containing protein [Gammaproteobacteria bacterium]
MPERDLNSVCQRYDRWSQVYDADANPLIALEGPVMRQAVGQVHGLRIADLGCGTGRHTLWMANAGASVVAVDFSSGMLASARAKTAGLKVAFSVCDLNKPIALASAFYDMVVSALVLEHLYALDIFFAEIQRLLRPGGSAIISAMHPAMFLRGSQARFIDPVTAERIEPGSVPHSLSDFVMAIINAGLTLCDMAEHAPDETLAVHYPRAEKYIGWPMLVIFKIRR